MDDHPLPRLRILASGSSGNCSVLICGRGHSRRILLIDAGLSPRRTRALLAASNLTIEQVSGVILTHLDSDHWNYGWTRPGALPAPVWVHRRHEHQARRLGIGSPQRFDGPFDPADGQADIAPILMAHDDHGVAAFRFDFADGGSLGFATDLGRLSPQFIAHMTGVDVLALESNYCPAMQAASNRPYFLKQRIMSGHGHLSNQQAASAAADIRPRQHLVLLHLSRQCNTPDLAARGHASAPYRLTIADQHEPTPWIEVSAPPSGGARRPAARPLHVQTSLFSGSAPCA